MPYFGEVREFAIGYHRVPMPPYLVVFTTETRIWTGHEWAALGTKACDKALQAMRDDGAVDP